MLKSSSLCFYSLNLGTFWLKIEPFWPFEEISIFSNGGHLGYRTALTDTILKGDHPRIISAKFGWDWLSSFRGEDFLKISSPFFLICIIGQNRQKFKVHKKSRNICQPEALKSLYLSPGYKKKQLVLCKNYVLQW